MIGRKQQIFALYFESENELKFYNLEARSSHSVCVNVHSVIVGWHLS